MSSSKKRVEAKSPTHLSDLSYTLLKRLGDRLDMDSGKTTWWRKLIEAKNDDTYSTMAVAKFAQSALRSDGSPGYDLLLDMSNRGMTFDGLTSLLKKIKYYDALKDIGYKGLYERVNLTCGIT